MDIGQDHDTCWHEEIDALPTESGGWWHIYQQRLRDGCEAPTGICRAAMDIQHRAHAMNLMGNGGPSETFTPFVRITNSYNGTRALRIDVGFLREHCSNGVIFEQEATTLTVPHTRQGIHSLKVARPFAGMSAFREEFKKALAGVRSVGITPERGRTLVRQVTGWPQLPEDSKPWARDEQAKLDADLETRLFGQLPISRPACLFPCSSLPPSNVSTNSM